MVSLFFYSIDDAVDYWHNHETGNTLQEFLGFTDEEYCLWLKTNDESVLELVRKRRDKKRDELMRGNT